MLINMYAEVRFYTGHSTYACLESDTTGGIYLGFPVSAMLNYRVIKNLVFIRLYQNNGIFSIIAVLQEIV